jgi:RNA polymerase sigma factor (TIGR02999 family)
MTEVSQLLTAIDQGDAAAASQLFPIVYDELRRLAATRLAQEKPGQTLDATALVHEAYVRMVGTEQAGKEWQGRSHFFAAAADAMRHILVDQARKKRAKKRGGDRTRQELHESAVAAPEDSDEILAVDEALGRFMATDAQAGELVKLRYFAGLSIQEAAQILNISPRKADRLWAYARAWLRQAIDDSQVS